MSQQNIVRTNTDDSFWHKQWKDMTIDFFQLNSLHPMLTKHINLLLENREKVRFFFPLCGKVCNNFIIIIIIIIIINNIKLK